jgi:hypothetical protein
MRHSYSISQRFQTARYVSRLALFTGAVNAMIKRRRMGTRGHVTVAVNAKGTTGQHTKSIFIHQKRHSQVRVTRDSVVSQMTLDWSDSSDVSTNAIQRLCMIRYIKFGGMKSKIHVNLLHPSINYTIV